MNNEEAINMLYGMRADNLNLDDAYTKDKYDALEMAIKALEQEPKTGHWIVHEKPHGIRFLECPYCNIWYLNEHLIRNSFCPNCGAKMSEIPTGSNVDVIEG